MASTAPAITASAPPAHRLRWRTRHWVARYFWSRLPRSDRHALVQRNLYILPTGTGWLLAATLLTLLIASINYQLNLGYLLTFLIGGCAVVSVPMTYLNMLGLQWHVRPPTSPFAGQATNLDVSVHNPHPRRARWGLALTVLTDSPDAPDTDTPALAPRIDFDSAAGSHTPLQLHWQSTQRGWQGLPALQMETRFPLGIFRVWSIWRPESRVLVYPQPEPQAPPLPHQHVADGDDTPTPAPARAVSNVHDIPDQLRPYRHGDTPRHVFWKKAAQTGQLVVRETPSASTAWQPLWLDWRLAAPERGTEAALQRLCAWVLQADDAGQPYGLRLPADGLRAAIAIAPDGGALHRQRCLQSLAEFGLAPDNGANAVAR